MDLPDVNIAFGAGIRHALHYPAYAAMRETLANDHADWGPRGHVGPSVAEMRFSITVQTHEIESGRAISAFAELIARGAADT